MGIRTDFYDALRQDFQDGQQASFLYRYLKRERQASPKEDDYAHLERRYAQYQAGQASQRDYLRLALEVLIKNGKLRLNKGRTLLAEYGRTLGGADFFRGKRRDRDKYRALLTALEGDVTPMKSRDVDVLHQELLSAILVRDAQTYLYDAGRKKNRDMAMLEALCEDKELVLAPRGAQGAAQGSLTAAELEAWEALFAALRQDKKADVLIPIRIDPQTGAGLFIVGVHHYPKQFQTTLKNKSCYYAYFYLDGVDSELDISLVYRFVPEDLVDLAGTLDFPSLAEAERWYHYMLREDAGRCFRCNDDPPKGCPPELLRYFQPQESPEDDLAQEGREAYSQDARQRATRKRT